MSAAPRLVDLNADDIHRSRIVVLHRPRPAPEATTWTLSLVDLTGAVVGQQDVRMPLTMAMETVVASYLEPLGRRIDGNWINDTDIHGEARHRALLT